MDAAVARLGVHLIRALFKVNHGESHIEMRHLMPWPREESAPMSGDQLLAMVKNMNIKKRKPH
jgi:hypothetical protein